MDGELWLSGDLCQMGTQRRYLSNRGFTLKQINVYPVVMAEDVKRALTIIWEDRVDGYWHYGDQFVEYGVCTKEEFKNR